MIGVVVLEMALIGAGCVIGAVLKRWGKEEANRIMTIKKGRDI